MGETRLEKEIIDHIDRHPGLKHDADLIQCIPGIGAAIAAKILGHIGDVRRFESAKAFAAFLGVTPKQRVSGTSIIGRTMISRTGSSALRAALFMPSLVARHRNPILREVLINRLFADELASNPLIYKAA